MIISLFKLINIYKKRCLRTLVGGGLSDKGQSIAKEKRYIQLSLCVIDSFNLLYHLIKGEHAERSAEKEGEQEAARADLSTFEFAIVSSSPRVLLVHKQ